jgi:hypothetical protein
MPLHHLQFAVFLHGHRQAIAKLLEQAYGEVGGHYASLSVWQRESQANIDSVEFIADLLRGDVTWEGMQRLAQVATAAQWSLDDVRRLTEHLEVLFAAFVRTHSKSDPAFADALIRRSHHVSASFRAKLLFMDLRRRKHRALSSESLADPPRSA